MNRKSSYLRVLIAMCALIVAFIFLMSAYTSYVNEKTLEQQKEILLNAVKSALRTCYAIEGKYPADIQYLIDNYALRVNEDSFHIYFDAFADNVMPDVRVIERRRTQS